MIRILQMIGSLSIGGSQILVMNLYRKMNREEIQFDFIIDHTVDMFFKEEIESLGGRIYILPTFKGDNIYEIKKAWTNFFCSHTEYKILHSHVRSYASLFIPIAKKYGIKTIIHSHSTSNGKGIKAIIKRILQYPLRYQADYFIGCSEEAGKWLFGNRVIEGNKYHILKNGIELTQFVLDENIRNKIRNDFGVSDDIVFGHVGRLHEAKNHHFLLEVYKNLKRYIPNSKLVLIGDGELKDEIEKDIEKFELDNSVIMTGIREDISNVLMALDCFLFPSKWEGLPISVIEAQASGLPCFISKNITKEVAITSNIHYLSIDAGYEIWVNSILDTKLQRHYENDKIIASGFDISTSCEWIKNLYLDLLNQ